MPIVRYDDAITRFMGGLGTGVLFLLTSVACGASGGEPGSESPAVGGQSSGGTGATGGVGAAASSTGGAPETTGGSGNNLATGGVATTGGVFTTGGVGAGLGGGGTGSGGEAAGGVATGGVGAAGAATGGVGPGGTATGGGGAIGTGGAPAAGGGGAGASGGTGGVSDAVTRSASSYTFRHFPIETDGNDVWNGPSSPSDTPTSTTFETVVLENGYLRVTLLPSYGGRVLSIVHKPTDRELLYQNPLGTPYLMQEDIFYYNYLMILGGIFPSFPEPEHGRYWNQPYDFEVISESSDAITVRMSRLDDRDVVAGVPSSYDVGRTDIRVDLEVTLRAGSTSLELGTQLTNTRTSSVPAFEYWTVTTLAPGSTSGQTAIPLNTRIIAEMDQVHLLESSWSWFGTAEDRVNGEIFTWDRLSHFANWVDQGTAFANPEYRASWSGLINNDRGMGVLRVSESGETRGLKLWTFGRDSLNIDINDSTQWLRPTIEMWHGVTPEFWDRGSMAAGEVRQWTDHYFPTLGLEEITAANQFGAMSLSHSALGAEEELIVSATLTLPEQPVTAILRLDGSVVAEQAVVAAATEAMTVTATVPTEDLASGSIFAAEFLQGGTSLLSGQVVLP